MREDWLRESAKLLASEDFGADLAAVEAAQKKHEAIEMDILAYSERIKSLVQKSKILEDENYHDIGSIISRLVTSATCINVPIYLGGLRFPFTSDLTFFVFRRDEISAAWEELLDSLKKRRDRLERTIILQKIFQAITILGDSIDETKTALQMAQGSLFIEGNRAQTGALSV